MARVTSANVTRVILMFLTFGPWTRLVDGSRILAIETVAGKSHWNFMRSVLRALTDNGHHVTVFTPFPDGNRENYTEIDTSDDFPMFIELTLIDMVEQFGNPISTLKIIPGLVRSYCDIMYGNDQLKKMLDGTAETNFDVIFIEPIWSDCVSYLAINMNLPIVYIIAQPMITFLERSFLGHAANPASVSNFFSRYAVPETFAQRFTNTALLFYGMVSYNLRERRLKYIDPKPYDLSTSVTPSVLFINSNYIVEASRPIASNLIPVGGIHLKPAQTLPHDILEFIENSPHGVIYFTFGSVVSMSSLPEQTLNSFKEALAQVPQRVLWKFEGEIKDKPKNVMISKWFPQRDILLHPNVKLFISHGGISGIYEAVDAGVPILGFPLFYDQPRNIAHLVYEGMAISMDVFTVTTDLFLKNILEITNNEKYMKNAKIAADRFRDRPISLAESVVYWTEYVIRHKGAPHLKTHAYNLTWYQYYLLDVIVVLFIIISLCIFIMYIASKIICKYFSKCLHSIKTKSE